MSDVPEPAEALVELQRIVESIVEIEGDEHRFDGLDAAKLQSAFEIPDDDWNRIVVLAASLGTVSPDRWFDLLGRLATYRNIMMSSSRRADDDDNGGAQHRRRRRRRAANIVTLCDALLLEIGSVTPGALASL
jgi:hypothetical protein